MSPFNVTVVYVLPQNEVREIMPEWDEESKLDGTGEYPAVNIFRTWQPHRVGQMSRFWRKPWVIGVPCMRGPPPGAWSACSHMHFLSQSHVSILS